MNTILNPIHLFPNSILQQNATDKEHKDFYQSQISGTDNINFSDICLRGICGLRSHKIKE